MSLPNGKLSVLLLLLAAGVAAQSPSVLARVWKARWIDVPGSAPQAYGVYHFRRTFELDSKPDRFLVDISGDNRYELFVNGTRVSWGPARGDLTHWRYETVDIASHLHDGKNVLAAVVWNDGEYRAVAQISNRSGFLLGAERAEDVAVNTDRSWKCMEDKAYSPQPLPSDQKTGYYALGANEKLDAKLYPWGWNQPDYDDSNWAPAREISPAAEREARDAPNAWMLVPREIPFEEQTPERDLKARTFEGVSGVTGFPFTVQPHAAASVLLDQSYLTTAYPELTVSGGKDASVRLRYAEALYVGRDPFTKGNRNDIQGRQFYGPADTYLPDGGSHRMYRPLFWRTYRYLRLEVKTGEQPAVIERLRGIFTAYPFDRKAAFRVEPSPADNEVQKILSTGWRTARLCAHETYMDCPFYEQLQYAGDARIQMLISLYMTGDSRLMKNGIGLLNSSRTAEGATLSRAPSHLQQYIPPFSLWWIGMVREYWWYVDDPGFVRSMLPGVRAVLTFFAEHQKPNGSLARMPWWNFVDWVKEWPNGEPPADPDGTSAAALDLQLLLAYRWAEQLESTFGDQALAAEDRARATQLSATILALDWDAARGLFADQPSHRTYSQQVNTLAVLAHVVAGEQARGVVEKTIGDVGLAQSSIYFRAYTNAALREVGLGGKYLDMLGPWREMLAQGLTTWAEWNKPDTRSDCHAWGASPNYELLRTIAGIDSAAPGFRRVRIAPNLGALTHASAEMPHPRGTIRVEFTQTGRKLSADIDLPETVSGDFEWNGLHRELHPGKNRLAF